MSRRTAALIGAGLVTVLLGGCGLPPGKQRPAAPTASASPTPDPLTLPALPEEACAVLPDALRDQLVPAARVKTSEEKNNEKFPQELECEIWTDSDRAKDRRDGGLRVRIERQRSTYGREQAVETAVRHFKNDLEFYGNNVRRLPDVGDDAFIVVRRYSTENKGYAVNLGVLTGAANITIMYQASPSSSDKVRVSATALAAYLVAVLTGPPPEPPRVAPFVAP
ncbi:hypothetical protein [Micromonospora zhanjiangensis]|uniref:DUF3558 domain-containing protein n=1 Tax=Micromonospora zhanjiangensis TaxID=1522057 RepID=A0ABV8KPV0_9ACTN